MSKIEGQTTSGRVNSSYSTNDTRRVTLATNPEYETFTSTTCFENITPPVGKNELKQSLKEQQPDKRVRWVCRSKAYLSDPFEYLSFAYQNILNKSTTLIHITDI